ncbi:LysE family translocator [Actinoplanes friuliensis]|uniref:Lysine exporter LysE/YggA n=1 Tax=Actinoplanes friuliensis DSM 7358 TaxID=1246995 RepID=U5W2Z5_9ACTN|nr:LysE family translocator [Actinoplanes friuliensis]AGZ42365.1 lysine exporter LysE/YggA [Actinoplanes friuliensis DSM 7358]
MYWSFLIFALVVVLIPGPDFAVVTANTLTGGRRRGMWSAAGVATSNALQGTAAAAGLGALIVQAQPVLHAIKWAGIAYLVYLGVRAISSAIRGRYDEGVARGGAHGWRQGFLSNITNPKVLMFYLAVLPQFLAPGAGTPTLLLYAFSHAILSLAYLLLLAAFLHRVRGVLNRRPVRRALDAITGVTLLGFGARLATER